VNGEQLFGFTLVPAQRTETGLVNGLAKALGAAMVGFGYIQNGSDDLHFYGSCPARDMVAL